MKNPALFSRIFNTPLLIQPSKLDAIVAGIGGRFGLEVNPPTDWQTFKPEAALTALDGEQFSWDMTLHSGVAVIDIIGVLAHRGKMEANSSYILGYNEIGKNINAALNNPDINAILLQIDSPGGEVAGAFELASQIKAAAQVKPVKAVISSTAASAGYLIASAASDIAISDTGIAGSIGVVMKHMDISKLAEKEGVTVTYIYAGDHKIDGNPFEPLPKAVKADLQANIDKLYSLFVTTVSHNRGLSTEAVRGQQAQIYTGQDAINAGLADRIATPDEILAELQTPSKTTTQRRTTMSKPDNDAALEQQALDKARADGFEAGKLAGIKAERDRFTAVKAHESYAGREDTANEMLASTDMTADQIATVLGKVPKAAAQATAGSQFDAHMQQTNATLGGGNGNDNPDAEKQQARAGWAKAFAPYSVKGGKQ